MNAKLALTLLAVPAVAFASDNADANRKDFVDNVVSHAGGVFNAVTSDAASLISKVTQGAVSEFSRLQSDFEAGKNNSDVDSNSSDASRTTYASIAGFAAIVAFTQLV
ncbi:hypothetical protein GGI23_006375 [Coemansia sp. RSA 2559]|nr:hypothetical protein GGI23_006375 [Coemansia sp. RSA 2559]